MTEAWQFMLPAFVVGALASVAFGMMGSLVVATRISYLAGALAHAILGGIGLAVFAERALGWSWMSPRLGALLVGLVAAAGMVWARRRSGEREDSLISAIWSVGMAIGLIAFAYTPGYVEPMSYLFGNILLIRPVDVWVVAGLDLAVVACVACYYTRLRAVAFDEEFAALRGLSPDLFSLLLLVLTAVTVVLLVNVVGVVLVVALLTLPAALAGLTARSLAGMMVVAAGYCLVFTLAGLTLSLYGDVPAGPTIILVVGGAYLGALAVKALRSRAA